MGWFTARSGSSALTPAGCSGSLGGLRVYYALTEGVEKAFVADLAPQGSKATALGFYHTIVGIGLLPASLIAGFLFSWNPAAPFLWGSGCAVVTVVILLAGVRQGNKTAAGVP